MQEILTNTQINQKTNRLAHQLLENCFEQEEVFIGGIGGNGYILAEQLVKIIKENDSIRINLFKIEINKEKPWSEKVSLSIDINEMKNGYIVLVDDVVNSGKTMQYALIEILKFPTKEIKTVALVDRKHRRFPIKADFVGMTLSTTLKERVEVDLTGQEMKAFLV
jgi:pyrimidine operon attenuation protein/uracil phosphoribosyltransferase